RRARRRRRSGWGSRAGGSPRAGRPSSRRAARAGTARARSRSRAAWPCARPSAAQAGRPAGGAGSFRLGRRFVLRPGALEVATRLGEEDVVEARRVQLEVGDLDTLGVECPDDLDEIAGAVVQAYGDAGRRSVD